jgi:predicted membrane protein
MSLKLRYAAFLLIVCVLLVLFCIATVNLVYRGSYVSAVLLLVVLYLVTFTLGRRFGKIFFVLSFLRLLKKRNGVLSLEEYDNYVEKTMARRSLQARQALKEETLQILTEEGLITVEDTTILLLQY